MKTGKKLMWGGMALAGSGLILVLRPFVPLFRSLSCWAEKHSLLYRTFFSLNDMAAGMLNGYVALAFLVIAFFLILYVPASRRKNAFLAKKNNRFLLIVFLILVLITLSISVNRSLWNDEIEHIHSAWYVENGHVPYRDFFQQHHPLLWYMLAPILSLFGYTVGTIMVLRLVILMFAAGIAGLTFRLAKRLNGSTEAGFWAVLLLLSQVAFAQNAIEIRPDIPQVFFALLALDQLLGFLQSKSSLRAACSGFSAAVSFLFLQKSVFFVIACCLILLFLWVRKNITSRSVFTFSVFFLGPLLVFLVWLLTSGAWHDYLLTNWLLNMTRSDPFSPLRSWAAMLPANFPFWLLVSWSAVRAWKRRNADPLRTATVFIGVFLLLTLFFYRRPLEWYFLLPICVLAAASGGLAEERFHLTNSRPVKFSLIFFGLVWPALFMAGQSLPLNGRQLETIEFVLANTGETDPVYDGNAQFNVFRPDLHYLWFNVDERGALADYNRLSRNRFGDYDACRLIRTRQPRFISTVALDWRKCGLDDAYEPTPYPGLLVRRGISSTADGK